MNIDQSLRILLVDDDRGVTTTLKAGLEHNSISVDSYNDPEMALSEYKPGLYSMIILDIRMPKISGFELYRELKKRDPEAKICFLTAFDVYYDEFKKVFPDMDVDLFLRKPIKMADLVAEIKKRTS